MGLATPGLTRPESLPGYISLAFILTEDEQFFSHHGVNWRAFWDRQYLFISGQSQWGAGSGLTEQVMRYAFFTPFDRIRVKPLKMLLALIAERNFSKEELLTLFLSNFKAGFRVRGLECAARYYFKKPPHELTLVEVLFLAYTVRSPTAIQEACLEKRHLSKIVEFLRIKLFEALYFFVFSFGSANLGKYEKYTYQEIKNALLRYQGRKRQLGCPAEVYQEIEWLVLDQLQDFNRWLAEFDGREMLRATA